MFLSRLRPAARALLAVLVLLPATAVVAGFFGRWIEPFDSLAHFRAHLAILLLPTTLAAVALRRPFPAILGLACMALAGATTWRYMLPAPAAMAAHGTAPHYRLLQMNLRFDAVDKAAAVRRIGEVEPDVVTLQEVTDEWRKLLDTLQDRYPYRYYCSGARSFFYSAILSRRPFADGDAGGICLPEQGFVARSVDFNGVSVAVASMHLDWPWPHGHWSQVRALEPVLDHVPSPLVLAGDFNAAPWSAAVSSVAEASGTKPAMGIGPTWIHRTLPRAIAPYVGLPIDTILHSAEIDSMIVKRLQATTSDHLPLLARFALPGDRSTPAMTVAHRR